jgi:uncharacterized membrane protein
MNSWKIILAALVIFGAGVVTGGLLVNHVSHTHPGNHRPPRESEDFIPRPDLLKTNFVERLDKAVHLTPEQREAIEKIIAEGQQRNREIWKEVAPQFHPIFQEVRRRIREALSADQQKQFEELLKRPQRRPSNATNAPPIAPPPAPTNPPPGA